jgi:hypothetical protein
LEIHHQETHRPAIRRLVLHLPVDLAADLAAGRVERQP